MNSAPSSLNPYVGPRVFTQAEKDRFFGREIEARELLSLVVSQRLVLFYAQSGAGKSSLIHARLAPKLQERGFVVLSVDHIGAEVPTDIGPIDNVYAFNLMRNLNQGGHAARSLARLKLDAFLAGLARSGGEQAASASKRILIIDQFEQFFTTHVDHWEDRGAFFEQLDRAMIADPRLWVLLALREDYVAALDPYALLLDDHLRARYYMQRMEAPAALQAVQKPVEGSRPFAQGVAEQLVENLRQIHVQEGVGTRTTAGQYVEPVQLQVVCYQLWENLKDSPPGPITSDNLKDYGDVDNALANFYNRAIKEVLSLPDVHVSELDLRLWFSKQLITEAGTRSIIDQGKEKTRDMPNVVVSALAERYLLRVEPRAGGMWVELVHDRFIEPIRRANRAAEAEQRRKELDKARQRSRRLALLAIGAVVLALISIFSLLQAKKSEENALAARTDAVNKSNIAATAVYSANVERANAQFQATIAANAVISADVQRTVAQREASEAQRQANIALSFKLVVPALTQPNDKSDLALLWGVAADRIQDTAQARSALLKALQHYQRLQSIVRGHNDTVWTIAFSPDGKTLASGGADDSITLWDASNPQAPRRLGVPLTGHTDDVASVAFNPVSTTLASGSSDETIILWDVSNPEAPRQIGSPLPAQQGIVESVAFSPDGRTLASGGYDGTIILWDVSNPRAAKPIGEPLKGHTGLVAIVAFSLDGRLLASGSGDQTAILWDVSNPRAVKPIGEPLKGHTDTVPSVAFSPNSKTLATGGRDESIILWDVSNPRAPKAMGKPLSKHTGGVESVVFSADGRMLASGSDDNTIILWDVSDVETPYSIGEPLTGHTASAWILAFNPDGKTLASGGLDNKIILWDVSPNPRSQIQLGAPLTTTGTVWSVAFNPGGKLLATGGCDKKDANGSCVEGVVDLWDVSDPRAPARAGVPLSSTDAIFNVAFHPDGKLLAAGGCGKRSDAGSCTQGGIDLWDVSNPRAPVHLGVPLTTTATVGSIVFNPDRKTLTAGGCGKSTDSGLCAQGEINLWDVSNPRAPVHLGVPLTTTGGVGSMVLSLDRTTLATGGCGQLSEFDSCAYGAINLWDVSNPRAPVHLGVPLTTTREVWSVVFSPDGKTLASGDNETIILWDVSDLAAPRRLSQILTGDSGGAWSLAFGHDGRTLAASSSNLIMLWDVSNPRTPVQIGAPLTGHSDWVDGVAFNPDGKTLASGGYDGTLILWNLDPVAWQDLACELAGRNLTSEEWSEFMRGTPNTWICAQWPPEPEVTPTP